jgi:plastocyanin
MKLSNAISVALAPVVVAKVARNKVPAVKRDPSLGLGGGIGGIGAVGVCVVAPVVAVSPVIGAVGGLGGVGGVGGVAGSNPLMLLYMNPGGGAQNQIVNPQVTVTQTVTVPAGGQATAIAGIDGVTTTVQPGSTGTMLMGGQTHTVTVGGDLGRAYFPADIKANSGDTIIFNFMSQNHTVTQSSFGEPCVPLAGGMDSGFMANPDNTISPPPQVAMQLMTSDPLWMYCAQGDHCSVGMVLSINPSLEQTHAQFQANAIGLGQNPATAITGGAAGGAPAAAPPAAADPNAIDPALLNPDQLPDPNVIVNDPAAALPTIANLPNTGSIATGALNGGIVMGVGSLNADGSCNCAVQCDLSAGVAAAASIPDVGIGGFGGQVAVIPMNAAGVGAASVNSIAPVGVASVDPFSAATLDPLGAATVDPAAAGSTGLIAPDPAIVGRRH